MVLQKLCLRNENGIDGTLTVGALAETSRAAAADYLVALALVATVLAMLGGC